MGNRAVITASTEFDAPAIYLHWNGGRDSVEGFLKVAREKGFDVTTAEGWDQFAQFIAEHFFNCDVGRTVYREPYGRTDKDNGDNGVYLVDDNWNIWSRLHEPRNEQQVYNSDEVAYYVLYRSEGLSDEDAEKAAEYRLKIEELKANATAH